jgi:hypothetical protein
MQITLNIKDEKELQKEIKELVKAKVKEIAREDIKEMYESEVKRVVAGFVEGGKKTLQDAFDRTMESQLKTVINWALDNHGSYWRNSEFVKTKAAEIIREILPGILKKKIDIDEIVKTTKNNIFKELEKLLDK